MSFSHLIILGIIAVIVIPPEKLPEVARQIAKFLGEMRRMSSGIFDDLKQEPKLTPEDMLKKQQQFEQVQQQQREQTLTPQQSSTQTAVDSQPKVTLVDQQPEILLEEKKKAEDEYLKHIQGDAAPSATERKNKDE